MVFATLVDTAQAAGLPAPHWFIQFFKVLGFTLHAVPMNLWYAGLLLALCLHLGRNQHGREFAARLIAQMPVIIAVGVNLGIVPLLFIQVAYFKFFYPDTILMAWFWLGIIVLLIPAYYGVYSYAWGLRKEKGSGPICRNGPEGAAHKLDLTPFPFWRHAAGWIAALMFIAIGFIFANGMSLMDHIDRWDEIWNKTNVAGAALGTGLNIGDPTLWPRWLLMFGLALGTTAAWALADTVFFNRKAAEEYNRWIWKFAKIVYTLGLILAAAAGTWYVFGTWSAELRKTMFSFPAILLTVLTALAPGLPWVMIVTEKRCPAKRPLVAGIALAQLGVLGINAVSRQVVQNVNIGMVFDVFSQKTDVQWGPMAMFLAALVIGLGILAWMLAQVLKSSANSPG
ncbi:MAG: hypothetical protein ABSA26_18100 [Thermoguttaceae bacterium]